jgi:ABC-type glutathione transport system ATPase component
LHPLCKKELKRKMNLSDQVASLRKMKLWQAGCSNSRHCSHTHMLACPPSDNCTSSALDAVLDWSLTLSLGEQQRLAWARLLLAKPMLALLDEASSAMDQELEAVLYKVRSSTAGDECFDWSRPLLVFIRLATFQGHLGIICLCLDI